MEDVANRAFPIRFAFGQDGTEGNKFPLVGHVQPPVKLSLRRSSEVQTILRVLVIIDGSHFTPSDQPESMDLACLESVPTHQTTRRSYSASLLNLGNFTFTIEVSDDDKDLLAEKCMRLVTRCRVAAQHIFLFSLFPLLQYHYRKLTAAPAKLVSVQSSLRVFPFKGPLPALLHTWPFPPAVLHALTCSLPAMAHCI